MKNKNNKMGESANFWPIPMSIAKNEEVELFCKYLVFLSTK